MRRVPLRFLALAAFALQFALLDVIVRGPRHFFREPHAIAGAIASAAIWYLAASTRARVAVAIAAGTLFGAQALFAHYWHTPIDAQVVAAALHNWPDVRPVLAQMLPQIALAMGASIGASYALLRASHASYTYRLPALALALVTVVLALPLRDATPDLRLADALRLLGAPKEAAAATSAALPPLASSRVRAPNVLFVLTESVRASDACSAFARDCDITPQTNALFPDRVPLRAMRSIASYTAVSLSAIVTGRTQEGSRAEIASAPTIFEALRAVTPKPTIAYWSAQSEAVFERDVRGAIDSFVTLETLLGRAVQDEDDEVDRGVDRLLTQRFVAGLPSLAAPYFVFLHFAGTHAPYFVNDADAPFRPYTRTVAWATMDPLHNAYRDAIHEQDKSLAEALRAFVAAQGASPWVILFTSDHGEAFGEHGAIHHGQSLYDEQIHVPAWIAFGNGAFTDDEAAHLRAHRDAPTTHLDLLPTILDAYGVLDAFAFAPYAKALRGQSLLEAPSSHPPIPITNCTAMFTCPLNTWGLLDGDVALEAQRWDDDWSCLHLSSGERIPRNDARCDALRASSRAVFPTLPNGKTNTAPR